MKLPSKWQQVCELNWIKNEDVNSQIIQVLFERMTLKLPDSKSIVTFQYEPK